MLPSRFWLEGLAPPPSSRFYNCPFLCSSNWLFHFFSSFANSLFIKSIVLSCSPAATNFSIQLLLSLLHGKSEIFTLARHFVFICFFLLLFISRQRCLNITITTHKSINQSYYYFYQTKTTKQLPDQTEEQDNRHRILWSVLDWEINKDTHKININPKYADDICFIRSDEAKIHQVERIIPPILRKIT